MVDVVIVYFPVLLSRCCSAAKYYCIVEFMRITNASTICTLHPVSLQLAAMGLVVAACGHGSGGCCLHPASSCHLQRVNIVPIFIFTQLKFQMPCECDFFYLPAMLSVI